MKRSRYNPEIHHRKSIRLKGHDYAGGGLYFVTICAHRDFVMAAKGMPFGMMIMEMMNREGTLGASEERNRFVLDVSEERWIPYVTPGGMLARMLNGRS